MSEEKKEWAYGAASGKLYMLLHRMLIEAEAGKPMPAHLMEEAHVVMAEADELPRFNRLLGKKAG
jgi:hypothetical protein